MSLKFDTRLKQRLIPLYQHLATTLSADDIGRDRVKPNAYVLLASDYGNIGDLAIGYAQVCFLRRLLPNYAIHSIPLSRTYKVLRRIRSGWAPDDIALLVGGGNMGDMYPRAQRGREFIAGYLKNKATVSFPQSLIYTTEMARLSSGRREARALGRNPMLTLCAREQTSLKAMRGTFSNQVVYAPDIVFSLLNEMRDLDQGVRDDRVVLTLRQDGERARSSDADGLIRRVVTAAGFEVCEQDTAVPDLLVDESNPFGLVEWMISIYRRSEAVVTDRLHGMIFAAITGTPCVVLPNTNHKIAGSYHAWIEGQCPFITYLAELDEPSLANALETVTQEKSRQAYKQVTFDFSALEKAILQCRTT